MSRTPFDLNDTASTFEIPSTHGPEVLALLMKLDPVPGEEKFYVERVEKFCNQMLFHMVSSGLSQYYLNLLVERLFSASEICDGAITLKSLAELQFKVCSLFFK